ncbi:glycosyltransferase family 4 protein [Nostocaceae cyanobacterium CENA369]|uniref:Glycosyltransferase family 4 protein n=1 Tax=Dendronalium phyllosphericum CENA369 TaxID=1725256 RepID=A0A8J7LD21_9NOST|nr:glycosyltransferase family 4 protein [Dendronalium phyllosphericum]MBH8571528.1 glycosyltransferase family 4 protein [Dendronalium phyllosphericum CENA369]
MRILSIHNNYQIRGGEDESRESEERLLREMGHEVDVYQEHNDRVAELGAVPMALRTVWSTESYNIVKQKLSSSNYDIVHIQNFFPLISPSVYYAAKSVGVPVVQTLRNYRLLCPNGLFFRDGEVCEDCMGKFIPYPGVLHGCYRENRSATGAVATMLTVHRAMRTWIEMVDVYIALTEFARQKFIAGGLPAEKIVVKPNFVNPDPGVGKGSGGYALFVGRLSTEKGLDTLLAAWEHLDSKVPLKIVGDGPLSSQVMESVKRLPEVEWLGRRPMSEVHHLMGEAIFLIFPSKWYETFGRVAVEAFAKGTPVIAANIGAIAELVDSGRTGLHFSPSNSEDLAAKVEWALANPTSLAQMRHQARAEFDDKYTSKENYRRIMEIYRKVCNCKLSTI